MQSSNQTVLQEAEAIIHGPRNEAYGEAKKEFATIALMFYALTGHNITAQQAALFMVLLKLRRDSHKHKRDNIVDAAGYLGLLAQIEGDDE